jgi:hypothetical protein
MARETTQTLNSLLLLLKLALVQWRSQVRNRHAPTVSGRSVALGV